MHHLIHVAQRGLRAFGFGALLNEPLNSQHLGDNSSYPSYHPSTLPASDRPICLPFGFFHFAVPLLNCTVELVQIAVNLGEIIVRELSPLLLERSFQLVPTPLELLLFITPLPYLLGLELDLYPGAPIKLWQGAETGESIARESKG
jgi:hypothetical protein